MSEIRPATAGDAQAIRQVHRAAFPTALEADLVEALARDGDLAISLVAANDGAIVGHIAFSRMAVDADGTAVPALGLAPVAVLPGVQGKGIGTALIKAGIAAARAAGTQLIFVLGEPAYYTRFGFDPAEATPFASPYAGPYLMALRLFGERATTGRADYARAFADLA